MIKRLIKYNNSRLSNFSLSTLCCSRCRHITEIS